MSTNTQYNITIDNATIENVDIKSNWEKNQNSKFDCRIFLGWVTFGRLNYILKDEKVPLHLKRRAYNNSILSMFTYGLENMAIARKIAEQLRVTQRAMLGITLIGRIRNSQLGDKTRITDLRSV